MPVPVQSALSTLPLIRPLFSLNLQHCTALYCGQCTHPRHLNGHQASNICTLTALHQCVLARWQLLCLSFKRPPLATLCPGYPVARSVTRAMISDQLSHVGWGHCQCCLARARVTPARGVQPRTLPATCSDPGPPLEQGCAGRGLWLAPGGRWSQLLYSSRILR